MRARIEFCQPAARQRKPITTTTDSASAAEVTQRPMRSRGQGSCMKRQSPSSATPIP